MPFSESGITPDVIINPHAFPSRMTIGMLIESLAGKTGCLDGKFNSFTQFERYENDDLISTVGEQLSKHGFNFHGTEILYSGVSGKQLKAEIYIGVVYYQRLRHMVNDKAQARSTGPIDILTRQPVKGRKNNGGIRFGEMERDGLLAHGISYCLNDRLFKSSDYSEGYICGGCGTLLGVHSQVNKVLETEVMNVLSKVSANNNGNEKNSNSNNNSKKRDLQYCRNCDTGESVKKVAIPYVLRYLVNELAGMNIKLNFKLTEFNNLK
jgi:DNA-directed RNA polymerase I subunit RPA2